MCDNDDITARINMEFSKLYHTNDNNDPVPFVCVVCDHFLKRSEVKLIEVSLLQRNIDILYVEPDDEQLPQLLFDEYTVQPSKLTVDNGWLYSLLLSPYGTALDKEAGWKKDGYACCSSCKFALEHDNMPRFAIANDYWFGKTPDCLRALSRLELALSRSLFLVCSALGFRSLTTLLYSIFCKKNVDGCTRLLQCSSSIDST